MKRNYETDLPQGYRQVYHIDAKDKKVGLIMNAVALAVMFAVLILAFIPLLFRILGSDAAVTLSPDDLLIPLLVFGVVLILHLVVHELIHGAAYKLLTHQKLTFGMSWSCAFCGVPNIYVYRHAAFVALLAPFAVLSVLFLGLCAWMYFVNPSYYILAACLLGVHTGGCCGDLYLTLLLLFRFRNRTLLIRDTGPEQFLYDQAEETEREHEKPLPQNESSKVQFPPV